MSIIHPESGTRVDEIAPDIYRISTPVPSSVIPGGFTFNQILIRDRDPLLFHTGPRRMFPLVHQAVAHVLGDAAKLRYVGLSHVEADECGALGSWLEVAPAAQPLCSQLAAMVSISDLVDRPARALGDGEALELGAKTVRWLDAPHVPHNWECGFLFEETTRTLLSGDLFTHLGGAELPPLTDADVLAPAVAAHEAGMSGMAVGKGTRAVLEKLAATRPTTLALMHGSAYRGDGARLLRGLADALGA